MNKVLDYIFIDTSVFIQERFFKESGRINKLFKLAKDGYICILLPVITEKEWLKHFKEQAKLNINWNDIENKLALLGQDEIASKFLDRYKALLNNFDSIGEIDKVFNEMTSFDNIIRIDYHYFESTTADVFDKYFKQEKPFGSKGKAKEFPDAFVLASLEKYANENSLRRIVIFSIDQDMKEYKSKLLDLQEINVYLDDLYVKRIPDINKREKQQKDINKLFNYIDAAKSEFILALKERTEQYLSDNNRYISHFSYAEIEDVSGIDLSFDVTSKDMEIIDISDEIIEAVCFPEIDGTVQVKHFSEEDSLWDSEDKEWIVESYKTTEVEISSYCPVTIRMERNELEMEQDPDVKILDIDFRPLQSSLDNEYY